MINKLIGVSVFVFCLLTALLLIVMVAYPIAFYYKYEKQSVKMPNRYTAAAKEFMGKADKPKQIAAPELDRPVESVTANKQEIDKAVESVMMNKRAGLNLAYNKAIKIDNPDIEAEVKKLSRLTGFPASAVRHNMESMRNMVKARQFKAEDLIGKFPKTAKFMATGDNARLVTDDLENLQEFKLVLSPPKLPALDLALFFIYMFGGIFLSAVNADLLAKIYDKNETRLVKRIKLLKLKLNISKLKQNA